MINFNGQIISENSRLIGVQNRAFKYGDAIFDTLKYNKNKVHFIEDHYFRLMSSLRMLRMKIPMNFTLKFYEDEIIKTITHSKYDRNLRIRVSVYRKDGGLYNPVTNDIDFIIEVNQIKDSLYDTYEIELFKDFSVNSGLLSTIKTNNRMVNIIASIFTSENNYQNCVLINEKKNIIEANNANIFLIKGNKVLTPSIKEGCIFGIIRKKMIELLKVHETYDLIETSISPFELLKADEVFLTNSITEIQSVNKYRKKIYTTNRTENIRNLFTEKYDKM
ncbi:MAG: aminotransferase class IV [Flavobacteriaceae bacterium]|nr:aminotransferase class IV [Flavobacteriaceae bacterium]